MKKIHLANNKGITLVDDEDFKWLNKYNWHIRSNIKKYASTCVKINNEWKQKSMHRLIMKEPDGMQIDHIDRNKLNNQKCNLRIVTHSQNNMNKEGRKNSSSKFKGITWDKSRNKWQAQIVINKEYIYLGRFNNEINAAKAYNKAAIELFGEYACLNEVKI